MTSRPSSLARRGDTGGRPRLHRPVDRDDVGDVLLEAVAAYGGPEWLPLPERLERSGRRSRDPWPERLDEALAACRGQARPAE